MTFEEAKAHLAALADGEYYRIQYEEGAYNEDTGGDSFCRCDVYIHGYKCHNGSTWEEALKSIAEEITGVDNPSYTPGQAPTCEPLTETQKESE